MGSSSNSSWGFSVSALATNCGISDLPKVFQAHDLCDRYGLDTISAGVSIAFAMELHEKGLLDDPELSLEWGDAETLLGLLERMAHRQQQCFHTPGADLL